MVKKLTREGLRRLIVSEVKRIREGGPGQDFDDDDELAQEIAGHAAELFKGAYPYDETDPSMRALGKFEWRKQLELATQAVSDELIEPVQSVISDVAKRLIDGEFFRSSGARGNSPGEQGMGYRR